MLLQEDTVYTFDYTRRFNFADLSDDELISIFLDGRYASEFLSYQLTYEFPDLTYVDLDWFDFSHIDYPQIEQKQITRKGFKFLKSSMIGAGRKPNRELMEEYIRKHNLYYLVVSTVNFPIVHVKLLSGIKLLDMFPQKGCGTSAKNACNTLDMPYEIESP